MVFNFLGLPRAYGLLEEKLIGWYKAAVKLLPDLVVATLVIIAFYFLAKLAQNLLERLLDKLKTTVTLSRLLSSLVFVIVFGIGVFAALGIVGLDKTVTTLLAGAGVIGLALSFAFQNSATNLLAGVFLTIQQPFKVGDVVETNDFMGVVQKIGLRTTVVKRFQGQEVLIPNKEVFENPLVNHTTYGTRRVDLTVGVSYGDDLDKVKNITLKAIKQIELLNTDHPVKVWFDEFGDSSINFRACFWISKPDQPTYNEAKSQAIMSIKKAYDNNDIMIPFPIRTLDFGIKGGEKLSEDET